MTLPFFNSITFHRSMEKDNALIEKWILLGGGGHGCVLLATLHALGWKNRLLGVIDSAPCSPATQGWQVPYLGDDAALSAHHPHEVRLLNGVGSIADTTRRGTLFQRCRAQGYIFQTVCHPTAWVADGVELGEGAQIMAGATVQAGVRLGHNVLINTRAVVEHDCQIQEHVHIASGAILCGDVKIGKGTHVGAGATVIQAIHIGENTCIGAGSVVVHNLPNGIMVVGVPAREMCK